MEKSNRLRDASLRTRLPAGEMWRDYVREVLERLETATGGSIRTDLDQYGGGYRRAA